MTCKIAFICGKQGLSIIPALSAITQPQDLMIFPSQAALKELGDGTCNVSSTETAGLLREGVKAFSPDVIIVMTYLSRLDCSLSELSKFGMINIHPSLLPKYRGGAPVFHALKNAEEQIGVTYHFMTEAFDQGQIISQEAIRVLPTDCASSVWLKVIRKIISSLPDVIERRSEWHAMATSQDEALATSAGFPSLSERSLSSLRSVAENLSVIRACGRSSGARLELGENIIFVAQADLLSTDVQVGALHPMWVVRGNSLLFKVADGWLDICAAYLNQQRITSWDFLVEELSCEV